MRKEYGSATVERGRLAGEKMFEDLYPERKTIPSAIPADVAERISDVGKAGPLEIVTEAMLVAEQAKFVDRCLTDPYFWADAIVGDGEVRNLLPDILARVMANLDRTCDGESIGRDAITTALSQLQRAGRRDAESDPDYPR